MPANDERFIDEATRKYATSIRAPSDEKRRSVALPKSLSRHDLKNGSEIEVRRNRSLAVISLVTIATACGLWLVPSTPTQKVSHTEPSKAVLKHYAFRLNGTDEIQNECLDTLWTMESHWSFRARGSKTSLGRALGIPQALPAKKMASVSMDYRTNPYTQIQWGIKYVKSRYTKACWALKHELNRGWY